MNEEQLEKYIKDLGIARDKILREEAEMEILNELGKNKIGSKLIFYGGTALRLVYGSPRFSEDIDLMVVGRANFNEFRAFAIKIADKNGWKIKDIKDKRQTMFALVLIKDLKMKHAFSVKLEIHKPAGKINIKTELRLVKSPLSILEPLLLVPTLEELKRLKEAALLGRKKARDIFDIWYISQSLREPLVLPKKLPKYKEREFNNELKVFLPKKYYPIIKELYGKINK